jgi:hypothetical protein
MDGIIYLSRLSDAQVEKEISELNAFQREVFDEKLAMLGDRRHALFIAKSYPDNWKGVPK